MAFKTQSDTPGSETHAAESLTHGAKDAALAAGRATEKAAHQFKTAQSAFAPKVEPNATSFKTAAPMGAAKKTAGAAAGAGRLAQDALMKANSSAQSADYSGSSDESDAADSLVGYGKRGAQTAVRGAAWSADKLKNKAGNKLQNAAMKKAQQGGFKAAKSAGKGAQAGFKTTQGVGKTAQTAGKTAQAGGKAAVQTAQTSAKLAQRAAQAAAHAAKAAAKAAQAAAKAVAAAVKAAVAAIQSVAALIAAAGIPALIIICAIALLGAIIGFVAWFTGNDSDDTAALQTAVQEINADYNTKISELRNEAGDYDAYELRGGAVAWKDVLAVYLVLQESAYDNPGDDEFAPKDVFFGEDSKATLSEIFWEMNKISHTLSEKTVKKEVPVLNEEGRQIRDADGNPVTTIVEVTEVTLVITVWHEDAMSYAFTHGFTIEQRLRLAELLSPDYGELWRMVLYGFGGGAGDIVAVALAQVGNTGGTYWTWYGYGYAVNWCVIFVSWCANACGYIDSDVLSKQQNANAAAAWFIERGQWHVSGYENPGGYEPKPGDIIFYDWDRSNSDPYEHVAIVERYEDGRVYTVGGNQGSSDAAGNHVTQGSIGINDARIRGYGVPAY
ncbi:MAG: CHAP domain-containing protein [Oscillospiraceae bacterium]|jgi:hypothetical protein|nr:CHAP domain-containing protein [Oscillospiraceae bacterium]